MCARRKKPRADVMDCSPSASLFVMSLHFLPGHDRTGLRLRQRPDENLPVIVKGEKLKPDVLCWHQKLHDLRHDPSPFGSVVEETAPDLGCTRRTGGRSRVLSSARTLSRSILRSSNWKSSGPFFVNILSG